MNSERIKEIQQETAYPESVSVQQALLQVWNECEQERLHITADAVIAEVDKPLPTDEEIEAYALENILDGVGIQSMINTKAWIAGATWMRDLILEKSKK